jgi:hypothetical protein
MKIRFQSTIRINNRLQKVKYCYFKYKNTFTILFYFIQCYTKKEKLYYIQIIISDRIF